MTRRIPLLCLAVGLVAGCGTSGESSEDSQTSSAVTSQSAAVEPDGPDDDATFSLTRLDTEEPTWVASDFEVTCEVDRVFRDVIVDEITWTQDGQPVDADWSELAISWNEETKGFSRADLVAVSFARSRQSLGDPEGFVIEVEDDTVVLDLNGITMLQIGDKRTGFLGRLDGRIAIPWTTACGDLPTPGSRERVL